MQNVLIRGLCVLIDVAWFLSAVFLIWRLWLHCPSRTRAWSPRWHHVVVQGGDTIYEDYWTTNPPPPARAEKPWFEYLNFTNENCH
ncbi:MAG TPA: hypothetical protein VNU95_04000 [Candidatus Acidoferrales bacterium]|jgi:hypothetical protein|nr:hypothetical protein [Candidatus Acidoferrales bacterium]